MAARPRTDAQQRQIRGRENTISSIALSPPLQQRRASTAVDRNCAAGGTPEKPARAPLVRRKMRS